MQWRPLLFWVGRPKSFFRAISLCSGRPMRWYGLSETLVHTVQRFFWLLVAILHNDRNVSKTAKLDGTIILTKLRDKGSMFLYIYIWNLVVWLYITMCLCKHINFVSEYFTTVTWTHTENGRKRSESSWWHESAREKAKGETQSEMGGWSPKGYAETADHPGGCTTQNILEIKNTGPWPHLVGKGEEEEEVCFNGYHREIKPLVTYSTRPPSQSVIGVCKDLHLSHTWSELKLMA